jgi:hypothetical protein
MANYGGIPGNVLNTIHSNGGLQAPNRFIVSFWRKNAPEYKQFLCDMVTLPAQKIKVFEDYMSGVMSPIPIPFGRRVETNIFQFVIEESWASRKYFEEWQSSIFPVGNNIVEENQATASKRINYLDEISGTILIKPQSVTGRGQTQDEKNEGTPADVTPLDTSYFRLYDCVPIQIIPARMEGAALNVPLKFSVNIFCSDYKFVSNYKETADG